MILNWASLNWHNSRKVATFVMIGLIFAYVLWIYSPIATSIEQINQPSQPLSFEEPIAVNTLPDTAAFVQSTDIAVDLNITYPLGILIVNESVSIFATTFMNISINSANLTSFIIGFQNALADPTVYKNGIPHNGVFQVDNPYVFPNAVAQHMTIENDTDTEYRNITIVWHTDGDYKPIIQLNYYDGSSQVIVDNDLVFHVYPTNQLTQIETNRINTLLTNALFLFGVLGLFLIAKEVWPKETKEPSPTIVIQTDFVNETKSNSEQNLESNKPDQQQQKQSLSKKRKKHFWQKH